MDIFRTRFRLIVLGLVVAVGVIVFRLISLQFGSDVGHFIDLGKTVTRRPVVVEAPRGRISDRDGQLMATNAVYYELGVSPQFVTDQETVAAVLSDVLDRSVSDLYALTTEHDGEDGEPVKYELLARPLPAAQGQRLIEMGRDPKGPDLSGVSLTPMSLRTYPAGTLAAHVLGFVGYDNEGYYGIEGFYDDILAGNPVRGSESVVPFDVGFDPDPEEGSDVSLTLDREVQYLAEETLVNALAQYGAPRGTIIIMAPQSGDILAMASWPTFDPNDIENLLNEAEGLRRNPAISEQYEPGSTFKVLTMAAALQSGKFTPQSTYVDTGALEYGGTIIHNWDGRAYGLQDMLGLLQHSLNVGAATLSTTLGPQDYYSYLTAFGIGHRTNIDLAGEEAGRLKLPGDPEWFDSDLATNGFGQGVATTPLQLLTAISAVANEGAMMQPHVLKEIRQGDAAYVTQPQVLGRPISAEVARTLTNMLATSLEKEASTALVPGYRIAGKTGTAQVPTQYGYDPSRTIASFVGWGPVDDPRFIVLIKFDAPTASPWGSQTAAPTFGQLVRRLVVLMEIPPDGTRRWLEGQ